MEKDRPPLRSLPQRAIRSALTPDLVRDAAGLWDNQNSSLAPIPAVQNFVYPIERPDGPAILRLTHESHRGILEVETELRWMIDLKQRALPLPAVHHSGRGALVETIESAEGRFFVTCFERVAGIEPDPRRPELWTDQMFERLGALIARLHQASYDAGWTQATLARRTWREESVVQNFHFYVPVGEKLVHRAFDRALAELDSLRRSRDSFGLIHADPNHANFFIASDGLNIFDFDDSCYCWFAYDLLVPIFHLPNDKPAEMNAKAQHVFHLLRSGYETIRRFNPGWSRWLSLLLRWRDLLTYGFFYEQLEIAALPDQLRSTFLAMRDRIEAERPIAQLGAAG